MPTPRASAATCPMRASTIRSKTKKVLSGAAVLFFWILIWETVSIIIGNELIFSSPVATLHTLVLLFCDAGFWLICLSSFLRILIGFAIGVFLGTLTAVFSENKIFCSLFSPAVAVIRCVPVASFIILAWYFLPRERVPVFTVFLIVMPIMWINVKKGIESVSEDLREVAQVYGFSFIKRMKLLYIPSVKSYFAAGLTASLGLAWKSGIAAEVLCRPDKSIGNEIFLSKSYLETPMLFAWTSVVVIFSIILEKILSHLVGDKNDRT